MGWWGITTNEKNQQDWDDFVWQLLDTLPDDTLLVLCDCHI